MRLEYKSRYGKFFLGSSEETYSCHVAVYDDENNKLISTNIRPEYELEGNDIEEIIYEIEEAIKRTWTTGDTRRECVEFIKEHQDEIALGNLIHELDVLTKDIEKKSERAKDLATRIADITAQPTNKKGGE